MGSERTDRGRELFDVVTRYAAIGQHRTGTPADARTMEWFRDLLLAAGTSRVEILPAEEPSCRLASIQSPIGSSRTLLSGWFECAGERGTGIAIAVALAAELAGRYTVVLAATTGHELRYLGAKHLAAAGAVEPHAVIHIGSSIAAAGEPDAASGLGLTPEIDVILNPASGREAIRQMLEPLGVTVRAPPVATDPAGWQGESECWTHLGVPISIAGYAPLFHTRDDVPASATSPSLMAEMCSVWTGVVNLFLERSAGSSQR